MRFFVCGVAARCIRKEQADAQHAQQDNRSGASGHYHQPLLVDLQLSGQRASAHGAKHQDERARCHHAESAGEAGESLETMMLFIAMMSQDEKQAELFERIEVTVMDSLVYLNYDISLGELMEMMESYEDLEGFPGIPSGPSDIEFPGEFVFPDDDEEIP